MPEAAAGLKSSTLGCVYELKQSWQSIDSVALNVDNNTQKKYTWGLYYKTFYGRNCKWPIRPEPVTGLNSTKRFLVLPTNIKLG